MFQSYFQRQDADISFEEYPNVRVVAGVFILSRLVWGY